METYNLDAAHAFQECGFTIQAISAFTSGKDVCEGVPVRGLVPSHSLLQRIYRRNWSRWLSLALELYRGNYDLVVAGHVMVLPQVASFAEKHDIPYWLFVFGIDIWGDWSEGVEQAIRKCNKIVAISKYTMESVQKRLNQNRDRVVLIHPMVDVDRFLPANNSTIHAEAGSSIVLTVGRLAASERYKGHDLIISALSIVQERLNQPIKYWIVGDGDDLPRLKRLAYQENVWDIVEFRGRVSEDDLVHSYQRCDVFAMPSYVEQRPNGRWAGEGFGIVYIEASACGKPVIACDVGGQTDAVIDGETGVLVKPTVESVANALIELLSSPDKARRMGRAGRRFVVENFSREKFNRKWANLLDELTVR